MTDRNELERLRTRAKKLARSSRIPHHQALDLVAKGLGHAHWNALTGAWNLGWRLPSEKIGGTIESEDQYCSARLVGTAEVIKGTIVGEPYELEIGFDDVLMAGSGWSIYLGHAPLETPQIERYTKSNQLDDAGFFAEAMKVANAAADKVRAAISRDWPRRSTKPDADGRVIHPLWKGSPSAEWHCLHCDAILSGADIAANMWHCPQCNATPPDIH